VFTCDPEQEDEANWLAGYLFLPVIWCSLRHAQE
jgi:hypothetical protein